MRHVICAVLLTAGFCSAAERPPQAPPVFEGTLVKCDCVECGGACVCGPNGCFCPSCPQLISTPATPEETIVVGGYRYKLVGPAYAAQLQATMNCVNGVCTPAQGCANGNCGPAFYQPSYTHQNYAQPVYGSYGSCSGGSCGSGQMMGSSGGCSGGSCGGRSGFFRRR